eukprot:5526432-Prymnesium_polylepis.1
MGHIRRSRTSVALQLSQQQRLWHASQSYVRSSETTRPNVSTHQVPHQPLFDCYARRPYCPQGVSTCDFGASRQMTHSLSAAGAAMPALASLRAPSKMGTSCEQAQGHHTPTPLIGVKRGRGAPECHA